MPQSPPRSQGRDQSPVHSKRPLRAGGLEARGAQAALSVFDPGAGSALWSPRARDGEGACTWLRWLSWRSQARQEPEAMGAARHRPLIGLTALTRKPRRFLGALDASPGQVESVSGLRPALPPAPWGHPQQRIPTPHPLCVCVGGVLFCTCPLPLPRLDPSQKGAPWFTHPSPSPLDVASMRGWRVGGPLRWRRARPGPSQAPSI